MAYKLIYNPLVDYIRSHVCICTVLLYGKASNLCYLLTVGWYTVACKPNRLACMPQYTTCVCTYVAICTYDGIKVGLLYNNAG